MLIMTPMITGYVDNDDAKLHPQQEQLLYIWMFTLSAMRIVHSVDVGATFFFVFLWMIGYANDECDL
jgi:hypothetical protein